jgi:hypothetical protein
MRKFVIGFVLFAAACSQGIPAPPTGSSTTVCTDAFCIDVPEGWEVTDSGTAFVSMSHVSDPDNTFLTAGVIDMEAMVTAAGGTWPVPTQEVVLAFWSLIEDAGVGTYTRSQRMVGGAVRSWGDHETGTMWHLVYPLGGSAAIGVEMRAPNVSWESHADVVFAGVVALP